MSEANEDLALVLEARDICEEEVTVPEWGGVKLILKSLTIEEVARIQKHGRDPKDGSLDVARANCMTIIEATYNAKTGKRFFEPAHLDALKKKSVLTIERLATRIAQLSGTTPAALAEATKNSLAASACTSLSPSGSDTAP